MAAGTVYNSAFFDSSGVPLPGYPRATPAGPTVLPFSIALATTSLDDAADRAKVLPLPHNARVLLIVSDNSDLDSGAGALDMDWVIADDAGDTIFANEGTAFNAARTNVVRRGNHLVNEPDNRDASLDLLVNVAASTAAAGTVSGFVLYTNG